MIIFWVTVLTQDVQQDAIVVFFYLKSRIVLTNVFRLGCVVRHVDTRTRTSIWISGTADESVQASLFHKQTNECVCVCVCVCVCCYIYLP